MKNICPSTRLRCQTLQICTAIHCARDRGLNPIDDRAEQYALAMADRKTASNG